MQSFAASELAVQTVARMPLAPYISPYIAVNNDYNKAVLQLRDSETGDVINQFPSEQTLQARQAQEKATLNAQLAGPSRSEGQGGAAAPQVNLPSISGAAPEGAVYVQEVAAETPAPPASGAGVAQAAIAALSLGASVGQPALTTTSITA